MHVKGTFSGLFMWMNGVVYMDVLDKEDRKNSRDFMIKVLREKGNIMIFPEGTWNLSPNELIYDIQLGVVDIAMNTGAAIVPISMEQYEEKRKFVINVGKVMRLNFIRSGNVEEEKIRRMQQLRDTMATLKYEIWEHEGMTKRADIHANEWPEFIRRRLAEWKGYDLKEQIINCYIPREKLEYWDMIHEICRMRIREKNCFLFAKK